MADAERITLSFPADSSQEAIAEAKAWVRNRPELRLRTIASCRLRWVFMWDVVVVVNRVGVEHCPTCGVEVGDPCNGEVHAAEASAPVLHP